jgi:(1->4)-alpha-D-glucan 1-alpha-D-glucosylmutase
MFLEGPYEPLAVEGPAADRVLAFARRTGGRASVVAIPRLVSTLVREDGRLTLENGAAVIRMPGGYRWCDWLSPEGAAIERDKLDVAQLFARFPVGVLVGTDT